MPWKIIIIVLIVLGSLYTALYTINTTSIDNIVQTNTPSIFETSIKINEELDDVNAIQIQKEIFEPLFIDTIKNNLSFYQGSVSVWFYYYNVPTMATCSTILPCNGVQIKIRMNTFYMFNKERIYRFEVQNNG